MLVDYAYPTMMAEKCLKAVHDEFLRGDFKKAEQMAEEAGSWLVEVRMALRQKMKDAQE